MLVWVLCDGGEDDDDRRDDDKSGKKSGEHSSHDDDDHQANGAKPHQYTDPDKLPLRTPDGKVRKPYEIKEQYQASLFPPKYDKVMLAGPIPDGLQLAQATLPQDPQDTVKWSFPEVFRPTVCYT